MQRIYRIPFIIVSLSSLCASSACGGGDGGAVEPDEIGEAIASIECARLFDCCDADELMSELGFGDIDTPEECEQLLAGLSSGFLEPKIEAAIASGRLIYHADRMGDCVDAMAALSCAEAAAAQTEDFATFTGCEDPFEGQVADGGACADDVECQSGFCRGDSTDFEGNVTEGVCDAWPGDGDMCDFGDCADGYYCDFGPNGEMCVAALSAGSECDSDDECETGNCAGGDPMNNVPGTCSAEYRCDGM